MDEKCSLCDKTIFDDEDTNYIVYFRESDCIEKSRFCYLCKEKIKDLLVSNGVKIESKINYNHYDTYID